jgi:alginate O-acetyltransferase complex protein AlgI
MATWLEKTTARRAVLTIGIIGIVAVLAFFKYNKNLTNLTNLVFLFVKALPDVQFDKLIMPLGISYIAFKYISYLIDIYWGITKKGNLLSFVCYGSLFTTFVAGPIERFERLNPQLELPVDTFKVEYFKDSFQRIVFGLFKKLVIADWLGYLVDPVWKAPGGNNAVILALALMGYSLQIYFDFAGYSDIAIGSSRLFGLKIRENFNCPYLAANITQFWSRWHISLSSWIRDYLFFPFSQVSSRKFWLMVAVPVIAMSICGIWHGYGNHFLVWGIWHGVGISIYQIFRKHKSKLIQTLINTPVATLTYVTTGWLLFHDSIKFESMGIINIVGMLLLLPFISFIVYRSLLLWSRVKTPQSYKILLLILIFTLAMQCLMLTNFIYMNF